MAAGTTQAAIEHHYDVGNDFYGLWLDRTLTYSCPLWAEGDGDDDLDLAQLRKLDYHADSLHARGKGRILDIGCGWGSKMARLITTHGVGEVVGLTLSPAQAAHVRALGIPRSEVQIRAWDEHVPEGLYDGIVSIEAFEHFGRLDQTREARIAAYRDFFIYCARHLAPGGRLSLQTTAYERQERAPEFITSTIWPESELPRLTEILEASLKLFEVESIVNHRDHYARTSRLWSRRLAANAQRATAAVGASMVENYLRYLRMTTAAFRMANYSLYRIALRRLPS